MKYTVKTLNGISEDNYTGTPFEPLFGTGKGSGASPAAWLTLIVLLMFTLDQLIPNRMFFESPNFTHSRLIDAFVDDTSLGFTNSGDLSCSDMISRLAEIAQTWEHLLHYSGGSLNLKKCSWYIMYWEWVEGRPRLRPMTTTDPCVSMTQGLSVDPVPITQVSVDKASRVLGVYLSPSGDFSEHIRIMKTKADFYATRLRNPKLTVSDVRIFHKTIYTPAIKYSLPVIAINEEAFEPVQSKVLDSILNGIGVARALPTYSPRSRIDGGP